MTERGTKAVDRTRPDFVVVGGGPSGCAAAIGLARSGARVQLLERSDGHAFNPGEILEPKIRYPLTELGLMERFHSLGFLLIAGKLSIWGGQTPIEVDSIRDPYGPGYLVDRRQMGTWLLSEAIDAGVTVSTRVGQVEFEDRLAPRIAWSDREGRREACPALVIEAVGRAGSVVGNSVREHLDGLVALLLYSEQPQAQIRDQRLVIEASADGWWYSAPLPGVRSVIAYMTDADLIPRASGERLRWLYRVVACSPHTSERMNSWMPSAQPVVRSAASSRRMAMCGKGWVSIGDAAATYDPLSGRGVVAALSKGTALARQISRGVDLERAKHLYVAAERAAFADYAIEWREIYSREKRWQKNDFWCRRHDSISTFKV